MPRSAQSAGPRPVEAYAYDRSGPLRYVVTKLALAPMSLDELVRQYYHSIGGDLVRVRHHEHLVSDSDAYAFMLKQALHALGAQVREENGVYHLTVPLSAVTVAGKRVHPRVKQNTVLTDDFHPMKDGFAKSTRKVAPRADDDLRASLQAFGWIDLWPAIVDERNVIIDGRRRITLAKELGITPVIRTIRFGLDDAGMARRYAVAMAANLASKSYSEADLTRYAESAYKDREWDFGRFMDKLNEANPSLAAQLVFSETPQRMPSPSTLKVWGGPGISKEQAHRRRREAAEDALRLYAERFDAEGNPWNDARVGQYLKKKYGLARVPVSGTVHSLRRFAAESMRNEGLPQVEPREHVVVTPVVPPFVSSYRQIVPSRQRWGSEGQQRAAEKLALDLRLQSDADGVSAYPNNQAIADRIVEVYGLPRAMPGTTAYSMYMRAAKLLGIQLTPQHRRRARKPTARA